MLRLVSQKERVEESRVRRDVRLSNPDLKTQQTAVRVRLWTRRAVNLFETINRFE
jgi:hypothetical protein